MMNRNLAVFLYSLACGTLLVAFSLIPGIIKYAFSLGAFFLGLKFFGTYETWGPRLALIGGSLVVFLILLVIYAFFAALYGWHVPGVTDVEPSA